MSVRRRGAQKSVPATSGIYQQITGYAGNNSWNQLVASTSGPIWLLGWGSNANARIQIGTGAVGAEQTIATAACVIGSYPYTLPHATFGYPIFIPAATRISANCPESVGPYVSLVYTPVSSAGMLRPYILNPGSGAASPYTTMTTAGTWHTVEASLSAAAYITHVVGLSDNNNADYYDWGTGAAGSEVSFFQAYLWQLSGAAVIPLPVPVRVPAGTRLAARPQTGGNQGKVSFIYVYESAVIW